jgi:small subunit ribosomal protein S6
MNKEKRSLYEGLYILRATLSDAAREQAHRKIITLIESLGGTHEKTIDWGRRKLAYRVKGNGEGHFYLIYFSQPTETIYELIRENRLNEDLLRFMNVLIEKVPEADEIKFKQIVEVDRER